MRAACKAAGGFQHGGSDMIAAVFGLSMLALAQIQPADEGGGGFDAAAFRDEMTPQMRAGIDAQISENIALLRAQGVLPPALLGNAAAAAPVMLAWPLQPMAGYTDPDYHGVSNFVDLDAAYPD